MGYRNLFLINPAKLSVKNEQLIIETEKRRTIPLEDIECIALDNLQTSITAFTLMKLCENGITVFVSNEEHLPTGILLPTNQHTRRLEVLKKQLDLSKPQVKQIWQQIVIAKIENQARVLKISGCERHHEVDAIKLKVKSGDSDNMEAVAAALYFKLLFGNSFSRSNGNIFNAFLNYGYAILRSTIAKNLCAYGFEPSVGIFHHSILNNFNLADDIIETYRPVIDLYVMTNVSEDLAEFTSRDKANLLNLLNVDILIDGMNYTVAYAIEKTIQSFSSFIYQKRDNLLLPQLIPLKQHEYE